MRTFAKWFGKDRALAVDVWLGLAVIVGAYARFSRIGEFDSQYYTAAVASFRAMAERGDVRYFLMPGGQPAGGPQRLAQQEAIINDVRTTWQDVSQSAGLPQGTRFRHQRP